MAVRFLNGDLSELCLGKPELTCVAASTTISDALAALRTTGDGHVSVWVCGGGGDSSSCSCVGKISMADVILFLCRPENLADPFGALESPVSDLLQKGGSPIVRHLEQNSSLLDAIDCVLEGAQNLVIPIQNHQSTNPRTKFPNMHTPRSCTRSNRHRHCWLTQEDLVRYLLNSVGAFSPIPSFTIDSLNIIDRDIMTIPYHNPASSALPYLHRALNEQTSIAVVDQENRLIGEISPFALSCSNETAACAIQTISAVDLMTYVECVRPPDDLVQAVRARLQERGLDGMVGMMDEFLHAPLFSSSSSSSCSSDDESGSGRNYSAKSRSYSARRSEAIVCGPQSSLVAVMIQALAHRVSCVWVVDEDYRVVGAVTLAGVLDVFSSVAGGSHNRSEYDSLKKYQKVN